MMLFEDRMPSKKTIQVMENPVTEDDQQEINARCRESLLNSTGHESAVLAKTGREAISLVLQALGGELLIPDQGIWKGTIEIADKLGIQLKKVKTHLGLIDIEELSRALKIYSPEAFLLTSFSGYIAEQNIKEIADICHEHETMLIEDASSSIGDRYLARGEYSDVIVGSARTPKLLNLPKGGFITSDRKRLMEGINSSAGGGIDPAICLGIIGELKNSQKTIDGLVRLSYKIKQNLEKPVHPEKRGICLGILDENPKKLSKKAREKGLMTKNGRAVLTRCPRFDRFLDKGVVLELKKLEISRIGTPEARFLTEFFS